MTPSTLSISIDGQSIQVQLPEGKTVSILRVALAAGIYIPHLCDHPDLTPAGHCRLCMVEVEGRGVVASCQLDVSEGLKLRTDTPNVQKARQVALELMLSNHPQDCLSCQKSGHCKLQEVTAFIGVDEVRFKQMRTLTPSIPVDQSNPFFTRDPNRCVHCGICVRTCDELQGVHAIDTAYSGYQTSITTAGSQSISLSVCESCGECVTRCPTGALVNKQSRLPAKEVKTTCTYCGVGCSLYLGTRGGEVVSVRADAENKVNEGTLCVKGRYGYSFINSPERLKTPLLKKNGKFEPISWDEALDLAAKKFSRYKGEQFAGIGSSRATNEENYVMQKFVRTVMQTNNVDNCARLCHAPTMTGLTRSFGTAGGTNPLEDIEGAKCIFVIGSNTTEAHAVAGVRVRRAAKNATLIVADPRKIVLVKEADLWLPLRPGTDVALLMGMARVILDENLHDLKFIQDRCDGFEEFFKVARSYDLDWVAQTTGVEKEKIILAARLYAKNAPALIMYSLGITEHSHGTENVQAIANLAMLTGNVGKPHAGVMPMRGQNNVQGACDMGCIPNAYPGSQYVEKEEVRAKFEKYWGVSLPPKNGLTVMEMLQAAEKNQVKAFYIVGMDPAFSVTDVQRAQAALKKSEFTVVQDIFLTGTAQFADLVLPAASFAEKDGTFTNLERRVQLVRKALDPIGESKPDWWIVCQIAKRMGAKGFDYKNSSEILAECATLTPNFAGLSFERLEKGGIQWPCLGPDHPGTPRLHTQKFNTPSGKGQLAALKYKPAFEAVDSSYPILLTTGRSLYHFHLAMTTKVEGLMQLHPEELVWIHPEDAKNLKIQDQELVKVSSRRGEMKVKAKVTDQVQKGQAFMTFHFYDQPTNVLTHQEALDPYSKTPEFKVTAIRIERL